MSGSVADRSIPARLPTRTAGSRPVRPARGVMRGFTLIEIMVVIVILGVLAAVAVPRIMSKPDEARVKAAQTEIAQLLQALDLYRLDNQRYPTTDQGLRALAERPTSEPIPQNWKAYLRQAPVDPWGRPYQYLNPGVKGEIDVFSLGADGQPGGDGVEADIGNWQLNR
jgi:general secretion pathway protein G